MKKMIKKMNNKNQIMKKNKIIGKIKKIIKRIIKIKKIRKIRKIISNNKKKMIFLIKCYKLMIMILKKLMSIKPLIKIIHKKKKKKKLKINKNKVKNKTKKKLTNHRMYQIKKYKNNQKSNKIRIFSV